MKRYFDLYRLGTEQKQSLAGDWSYSEKQILQHLAEAASDSLRGFMDGNLSYPHFMGILTCTSRWIPTAAPISMTVTCSFPHWVEHKWWGKLEKELEMVGEGGELPKRYEWVAELGDKTGRLYS